MTPPLLLPLRAAPGETAGAAGSGRLTVLKLGGELLDPGASMAPVVTAISRLAAAGPLIVVHGGGRDIDIEAARRGLQKQAVDGLRVTDPATLEVVVAVLAGTVNTRLVAALVGARVRAVGLSGVDGAVVRVRPSPGHHAADGRLVDLGLVGDPVPDAPPTLALDLVASGYVPVVACLGVDDTGQIYNVNADTLAAHIAAAARAERLIVAAAVAGVLDRSGRPYPALDPGAVTRVIGDGTATVGMVAKLTACRDAALSGVREVAIVDGRDADAIAGLKGTRVLAAADAASWSRG